MEPGFEVCLKLHWFLLKILALPKSGFFVENCQIFSQFRSSWPNPLPKSYQILTLDRFLHELSVGAIPRSKCVSLHEIFDIWTTKKWQKSRFGLSWLFLRFNISTTDFELVTKLGALKDFDESNNFLQLVSKYSKILRSYGEIGPPREKFGILKN